MLWESCPRSASSVWDATTFSKNRERLLAAVVAQPRAAALMFDEHFSVDGTLIQAWASHKSLQPTSTADDGGLPPSGRLFLRRAVTPAELARAEAQQRHTPQHDRSRSQARP